MSDEKTYTLDEVRRAFSHGAEWRAAHMGTYPAHEEAARRYPSPKKLREVRIDDLAYRVENGIVRLGHGGKWCDSVHTLDIVETLADLIAHPYEEDK